MRFSRVLFCYCFVSAAVFGQGPKVVAGYGNVPPVFEENRGQMDPEARYFLRVGNLNLFVTKTGPVLALKKGDTRAAVRMEVVGATGDGVVTGESPTGGQSSYFRGKDPSKWVTGAPQFGKARIREVRRGVDLLCYPNERQFEYDLVLKPGTKPEDVRLRFAGAERVSLTGDGELKIETAAGELVQHRPKVWQMDGERREVVEGRYRVLKGGEVAVAVGRYDRERELVIDPVVSYSTYLGGSGNDFANAIAVDGLGNAYVTGGTSSSDFPTTVGAYQVSQRAGLDVFVAKLNATGTAILYSTYVGGSSNDIGWGIAVDSSGDAYVAGVTSSTDFPVTAGAYQSSMPSGSSGTAFAAKLNPTGSALIYSTYLGGTAYDRASSIRVDTVGSAYVAGQTSSGNFPTSSGAYSSILRGGTDAFVTKLNPAGSQLVYSTLVGGSGDDYGYSLSLNSSNEVYMVGATSSNDFPTTPGSFQTTNLNTSSSQGFVSRISADGSTLVASTYLGGGPNQAGVAYTLGSAVALDGNGSPYVTGTTYSETFPTTQNAFATTLPTYNGLDVGHGFVSKLNTALTALVYSSLIGGSGYDSGSAIVVDSSGRAYIAGYTGSPNFPITTGSLFTAKTGAPTGGGGFGSAFLAQVNSTGTSLDYSTLIAGTGNDSAQGIALDPNGGVYVAGETTSPDFPVTSGAAETNNPDIQTSPQNPIDTGFVTKLDLSSTVSCNFPLSSYHYSAPLTGGSSSFAITVPQGCPWLVYNMNPSVVTINGPTHGFGNATVNFTVASNAASSSAAVYYLEIGTTAFTINQPAGSCSTPVFSPASGSFGSSGGTGQVSVALPTGCGYNVISSQPWLKVTGGSPGNGSGSITYSVDPDNFAGRSGTLSIAGTTFPVSQSQGSCVASLGGVTTGSSVGATGYITVTTSGSNCAWQAYSTVPWIQLATTSGTGSANVGFTMAPNPGTSARMGQVQIAGGVWLISQNAGPVGTPASYLISTIAGNGAGGYSGDGGPATSAQIYGPHALAYDASGNLYISETVNNVIRKVALDGTISTVVGTSSGSGVVNGTPATSAGLGFPFSLAFGPAGDLYIGEYYTGNIYKVTNGYINSLATGVATYSLAVDSSNNVYGGGSTIIQKVTPAGAVSTFAASGGPPAGALLGTNISGLAFDASSNLYLSDYNYDVVRRISGNTIATVAGTGSAGFNGDGVATASTLTFPSAVAVDPAGNVLVADSGNYRVRRFTPGGNITTIAGTGSAPFSGQANGDGGPALSGRFKSIQGLAIDPFGNIAVGDAMTDTIRLLTPAYNFCSFVLSSSTASTPSTAGNLAPTVTTGTGCVWNAYSLASWMTPTNSSATGSGSVALNIAANTTGAVRTGIVNIAGNNYTVTQAGVYVGPSVVSVSPLAGSGYSQTFTATYSETLGVGAFNRRVLIINSTLSAAHSCTVEANSVGVYLHNDADTALLGPVNPGSSISNSQCSLNGSGSSVVNSGNNSTVTVAVAFTAAFVGAKNLYAYADDTSANNTGYLTMGNYTVTAPPAISETLTPTSGSGYAQTFTANFTDTGGTPNRKVLIINSALAVAGSCTVEVDGNYAFLYNDTATALSGPLGGSALSNSQCSLSAATLTSSTMAVTLNFTAAFAGAKNLYLYASDNNGNATGYLTMGTYSATAPPAPALSETLTPTSGSGYTQTFTANFTDTGGTPNRKVLIINSALAVAGSCTVEVDGNYAFLYNDAATGLLGPLGASAVSNSQCSLSAATLTASGNTSTMAVTVTFTAAFSGAKNLYLYASDNSGNVTGYKALGTYTATAPPAPPITTSVTPATGSGYSQTFTATYTDTGGAAVLNRKVIIINSTLAVAGSCTVEVDGNYAFLYNDAGNGLMGPVSLGGPVSNSQCTLSAATLSSSGNNATVALSLLFTGAFAGAKNVYLFASDTNGNYTGYPVSGTYTATAPPVPPITMSVTPGSGSGSSQTFTATYTDTGGAAVLNRKVLIMNSTLAVPGSCAVETNGSYTFLYNDAGTGLMGPVSVSGPVSNNQCTLSAATLSSSGNNATVALSLSFTPAFAGAKNIYLFASDTNGNATGYPVSGTYSVIASGPSAVSISPSSGTGANQVFTAVFSDTNGASALTRQVIIINSTPSAVGGCVVEYDAPYFFLINDADTAYLGPLTPTGTLSNSQCTLNGSGTGAANSGNNSTLTLSIGFNVGFSGAKNLYLFGADSMSLNTGYRALGSYTVN